MSSKTTVDTTTVGAFGDVPRQLAGVIIKPRKAGYGARGSIAFNAWNAAGSPEGSMPLCSVRGAVMGSVGKSSEHRRGFDQYEFNVGTGTPNTTTRLALGLGCGEHPELKELLSGVFNKFMAKHDPVSKSTFYQNLFPQQILDGTQVYGATQAMVNPADYAEMDFQDEENHWNSPGRNWGSFLFGDEESGSPWYTKTRVDEGCTVYLYTTKMKQFQTTKENGQVVYPRGGVEVKNVNVLRTLLSSDMYKNKHWRVNSTLSMTGMELVCGQIGTTPAGHARHSIAPIFSLKATGAIVLIEHDKAGDEGGLTSDQRASAQMAAVFEGLVAPSRKRKVRDQVATQASAVAPTFNASIKKLRPATETEDEVTASAGFDEDDEEDSEGEEE